MASAPSRSPFWLFHLGGWSLFAVAMMVGRIGEWSLARIVVHEPMYAALAAGVTAAIRILYVRLRLRTAPPRRIAAVALLASYVGGTVWTLAQHLYLLGPGATLLAFLEGGPAQPLYGGPLLDGAVFHTAIVLGWSALYLGLQYYAALQGERERALRAEAQAHRAHLQALRYQLNPHFLFNALNGVSTLVAEGHARQATTMLARLSDFLRLTLDDNTEAEVALVAEIDFAQRYLEIERARFGDRLRTRFDIDDDALSAAVPALVLQPLVENAVKHAVTPREEGALIAIEARREGDTLVLGVRDDGPGLGGARHQAGLGIGLANVRDRLHELYGDAGQLDIDEPEGGGLHIHLQFPFRSLATPAVLERPIGERTLDASPQPS